MDLQKCPHDASKLNLTPRSRLVPESGNTPLPGLQTSHIPLPLDRSLIDPNEGPNIFVEARAVGVITPY